MINFEIFTNRFYIVFLLLSFLAISNCGNKERIEEQKVRKENVVITLYGVPACGKLTLANEISKRYDLNLVDNHFFNNIIFPFIELNTPNIISIYPDIIKIKKMWLNNVFKYGKKDKGFVFTNVFLNTKNDKEDANNLKTFANKLGYKWLPIKLVCSEKDIKKRIDTEQRRLKFKLVDFDKWKDYVDNTKFLDIENSLVIENTDINKTLDIIDKEISKK